MNTNTTFITKPYTYLIGWSNQNKFYYGVRFAKNCNPEELMKSYFTSSKYVKQFIEINGLPDIIEIRKIFQTQNDARNWETKVLRRLNVVEEEKWLNKTNNKSIQPLYGEEHPNFKRKGKNSPHYNKKRTDLIEKKRQEWIEKNPMHDPISKQKSINARSGDTHPMKKDEIKQKVSGKNNWIYKNPNALEERRQRFIEMNKRKTGIKYEKIPCPYCSIGIPKNNFNRHTNICKTKNFG
jgi:hypothetical protein